MRCSIVVVVVVLGLIVSAFGVVLPKVKIGRCSKNIQVQQNFTAADYAGVWYEQAGYNLAASEGSGIRCVRGEYTLNSTSGVVSVVNVNIDNAKEVEKTLNGTAVLTDPSKAEGKLTVTLDIDSVNVKGMYWVLATDYDSYAVVYACENLVFAHYYTVWYLSREQVFSSTDAETAFYEACDAVLDANNLDKSGITKSTQKYCQA